MMKGFCDECGNEMDSGAGDYLSGTVFELYSRPLKWGFQISRLSSTHPDRQHLCVACAKKIILQSLQAEMCENSPVNLPDEINPNP